MADEIHLSEHALELIKSDVSDGYSMIATCRAILSGDYSDNVFNSNMLSVFEIIADESDKIILDGFGEFDFIGPATDRKIIEDQDNEVKAIFRFYKDRFHESIKVFRQTYGI